VIGLATEPPEYDAFEMLGIKAIRLSATMLA
jgi:hypothetical protein